MERDFFGLNSKNSFLLVVKEEAVDDCKDSGFAKNSGVPWHVPNKVSALPHFMTFKAAQDERMHLASSGVMTMAPDAFDSKHKRQSGDVQNFAGATPKHQFVGGIPAAAARPAPSGSFVAGTTEPWLNKANGAPAQLTIFYGGAVNVFDDITPEKAHAIMFLAGNGCFSANMAQQRNPSPPKVAPRDAAFGNQTMVTKVETPKIVTTAGHVNTTTMMPSAVPQFRKASLARFLEKRKERVMSSSPYNLKKPVGSSNPEFGVADLSAGSSSVSTSKGSP